ILIFQRSNSLGFKMGSLAAETTWGLSDSMETEKVILVCRKSVFLSKVLQMALIPLLRSLTPADKSMSPPFRRKASKKLQIEILLGQRYSKNFKLTDKLLQPIIISWGNWLKNTINNSCGSRRITIENDFPKSICSKISSCPLKKSSSSHYQHGHLPFEITSLLKESTFGREETGNFGLTAETLAAALTGSVVLSVLEEDTKAMFYVEVLAEEELLTSAS
nr:hypothetical protein [Tanacetum cinerariifolium]